MVLAVDLPVQLGHVDDLIAGARHGAEIGQKAGETRTVGGGASIIVDQREASRQGAGLTVQSVVRVGRSAAGEYTRCESAGRSARQSGIRQREERRGRVGLGGSGEVAVMLVVGVLPEELVLDDGAASGKAPDPARVGWLVGRSGEGVFAGSGVLHAGGVVGVGIEGTPGALAVVEVGGAVNLVATAIGHRVDDGAGCAAILGSDRRRS